MKVTGEQLGTHTTEQAPIHGSFLSVVVESQLADTDGLQRRYEALAPDERLVLDRIAKKAADGNLAVQGIIAKALLVAHDVNPASVIASQESLAMFAEAFEDPEKQPLQNPSG